MESVLPTVAGVLLFLAVLVAGHFGSRKVGYRTGYQQGLQDGLRRGFDSGARAVMEDHAEFVANDPELFDIYNRRAAAKVRESGNNATNLFEEWRQARTDHNYERYLDWRSNTDSHY